MSAYGKLLHAETLKACAFSALLLLSVAAASRTDAQDVPSLHVGLNAGYSTLSGHYAGELDDSAYLGISFIPFTSRYLLGELDITYSAYELSGSEGSNLYSTAINAGPLFTLPLFSTVSLYTGLLARGNYFYLNTQNLDRQENTFKPGYSARAGMFLSLPMGLRLRAGVDYSQVWLSGEPFRSFNFFAGATYNVLHLSGRESASRIRERKMLAQYSSIETNYQQGVKEFNDGELLRARQNFKQILDIKSDHLEARSYMEKITGFESDYRRASELLENRNYYAAIPLLSRAEKNMKEARGTLTELRGKLAPLVPDFERRGIQYYDKNDYENCIDLMSKIQLIDPGNRTAGIYLPRAARRYEALKKLK